MLAHELRNPLAPICTAVELLKLQCPPNSKLQWATEIIGRQTQHLTHLINDLLEVARITQGKVQFNKRLVNLADIIVCAMETAKPLIDAGRHELTASLPPEPIRVEADPIRLEQVIVNLLSNAAKYTEQGGQIKISAQQHDDEAVMTISDTGIGIPTEMLSRIFDPFAQMDSSLDRSRGGLGLGLTLVRSLIQMHGGSVRASSPGPGQGSEFTVRLPALPSTHPQTESAGAVAEKNQTFSPARRVLVVDDNKDTATSLAMLLNTLGHKTHVAFDGPAALEAVRTFQPEIVLLDIGLPGMDGYEVVRRLQRDRRGDMLLVALTGYGQEEDIRRAKEAGFDCHLLKPVAHEDLQRLLVS